MIAIVNVGPHDDPNPLGERTYEVWINSKVITTFRHKRGDGLGQCLLAASKAVEKQKWLEIESLASPVRCCPFCEMSRGFKRRKKKPNDPIVKEARLDSTRWVPVCALHSQLLEFSAHTIVETRSLNSANNQITNPSPNEH